jgi:hypothetical protein
MKRNHFSKKRIIMPIFAAIISVMFFSICVAATGTPLIGDADGDGRLTSADTTLIAQYLAGHFNNIPDHFTHTEEWKRIADTNCDGEVRITSVTRLAQLLVGRIKTLCPHGGCFRCDTAIMPPPLTADDFKVTITVEEDTLTYDELRGGFEVYAELKNISGRDVEIETTEGGIFFPRIPNWRDIIMRDMSALNVILPPNGAIRREPYWGLELLGEPRSFIVGPRGYEGGNDISGREWLPVGTHELRVLSMFYIIDEDGRKRFMEVWSNMITLTVLP